MLKKPIFITLLITFIFCQKIVFSYNDSLYDINITLLNNPKCHLYHKLPYKTFDWISVPNIQINYKVPEEAINCKITISVKNNNDKIIYVATDSIKNQAGIFKFTLDEPLLNANKIIYEISKNEINLNTGLSEIDNVRFYGNVNDFYGNEIHNAWIVTLCYPYQIVKSDSSGFFEMILPKGQYNCIAAITNLYPRLELENYIWNLDLNHDFKYDFKIGKAEIFRLMASSMAQNKTISGSFIPWTCSGIKDWMDSKKTESYEQDDQMFSEEYMPNLTKNHVKFFLDNIEIEEIPIFEKVDVLIPFNKTFNAGYHFEFHIPEAIKEKNNHVLKIQIKYINKDGDIEMGQATLHDIRIY